MFCSVSEPEVPAGTEIGLAKVRPSTWTVALALPVVSPMVRVLVLAPKALELLVPVTNPLLTVNPPVNVFPWLRVAVPLKAPSKTIGPAPPPMPQTLLWVTLPPPVIVKVFALLVTAPSWSEEPASILTSDEV